MEKADKQSVSIISEELLYVIIATGVIKCHGSEFCFQYCSWSGHIWLNKEVSLNLIWLKIILSDYYFIVAI